MVFKVRLTDKQRALAVFLHEEKRYSYQQMALKRKCLNQVFCGLFEKVYVEKPNNRKNAATANTVAASVIFTTYSIV